MDDFQKNNAEQRMDTIIGNLLRIGVFSAGAIVLFGGILYLIRFGWQIPDYRLFHSEPVDLRTLDGIFKDTILLRPAGIIQLGILFLIATPVARVAFSVFAFARQRDLVYIIITLIVLTILIFSLAGGHL
jgi:uncharacterized membrane protein